MKPTEFEHCAQSQMKTFIRNVSAEITGSVPAYFKLEFFLATMP